MYPHVVATVSSDGNVYLWDTDHKKLVELYDASNTNDSEDFGTDVGPSSNRLLSCQPIFTTFAKRGRFLIRTPIPLIRAKSDKRRRSAADMATRLPKRWFAGDRLSGQSMC